MDWFFVHGIEKKIKILDFSQKKKGNKEKTTQDMCILTLFWLSTNSIRIAQLVRILGTAYVIGHCLCHCLSWRNLGTAYKVRIPALLIYRGRE